MFDMRYHITSLVAVFLALAVGIVLGTAIVNKGVVERQQTALVGSLRSEFADLRDRNRMLQEQANNDEQFVQGVLPQLIDARLTGKKVAVIVTDANSTVEVRQMTNPLKQAGAAVALVTIPRADLGTTDKTSWERLSKIYVREKLSREELRSRLLSEIATQVASSTEPAFLAQLADLGVLEVSGAKALPADAVVFLAGSSPLSVIEKTQMPLVKHMKKEGPILVGVEGRDVEKSAISLYQQAGANTVDNVDSPIGQVSLVMVLSGKSGHFGVKDSADALAPPLEAR